jgi:hypothetical protein
MNNETLTRKQKQKPCDLTNPVCNSLAGPHNCTWGRWSARIRVVGEFLEPHACQPWRAS